MVKKYYLTVAFLMLIRVIFAQTETVLNFNKSTYPSLTSLNGVKVEAKKSKLKSDEVWDAFHLRSMFKNTATVQSAPMSKLILDVNSNKILASNEYGFTLYDAQNLEQVNTLDFAKIGSVKKITATCFNEEKIIYASADLDDECKSDLWQIDAFDIKNGKSKTLLTSSDKSLDETETITEFDCPLVSLICSDTEGKNTAFKLSSDEFDNYCFKLYILKGKDLKLADYSCTARLVFMHFISEKELFYVTQTNGSKTMHFHRTDLKGNSSTNAGCYAQSGIRGTFNDIRVTDDKSGFYVNFTESGTVKTAQYGFDGNLNEDHVVLENSKLDLESDNYFLAFDYNIYSMFGQRSDEPVGTLCHDSDIFDLICAKNASVIFSADESGVIKCWENQTNSSELLIVENSALMQFTELNTLSNKDIFTQAKIANQAGFKRYNETQSQKELARSKRENDFLKMFELNNAAAVEKNIYDADKHVFAKFQMEANLSISKITVLHIEKQGGNLRTVRYCGRCVNEMAVRSTGENMLLAVLPDGKLAYMGIADFKAQLARYNNSDTPLTFTLKTFSETNTETILKEIFNN